MADIMLASRKKMSDGLIGLKAKAIAFFDFGTMRFLRILRGCWREFEKNCFDLLRFAPPPYPSPAWGGGDLGVSLPFIPSPLAGEGQGEGYLTHA